jgi:hypothetical protein
LGSRKILVAGGGVDFPFVEFRQCANLDPAGIDALAANSKEDICEFGGPLDFASFA